MPPSRQQPNKQLIQAAQTMCGELAELDFTDFVPWVYNPLEYAWRAHKQYLSRYARSSCRVLFLGMNPGPWGMAQTGVPFGEIPAVTDFLEIRTKIEKPKREHPKRPIEGFACSRSEVSGRRLWGLFYERFATADAFFDLHFVGNYCPLVFMEESARNITPDKLSAQIRSPLEAVCDKHLIRVIESLTPEWVIGVGAFAEKCAQRAERWRGACLPPGRILHPSPASPAANKDWAGTATRQLQQLGVW